MKNLFILVAFMCCLNATQAQTTFSLLQEGRVRSGTGKAILMTSGTMIDTLKATQAGYVLTWTGTDFLFSAPAGSGTPSLQQVTTVGNTTTTDITCSGGNIMLSTISNRGGISLRQTLPSVHSMDLYSLDLTSDRTVRFQDNDGTVALLEDVLGKLNIADTASMLIPYARTAAIAASYQPLDADLTSIAGLTPSNNDILQRKSGAWTNRSIAQLKTDLAIDTTDIASFYVKVRGLFSALSPASYNSTTGVISLDTTSATGLATQFDISSKLTIADTVSTLATLWDVNQLKPWFKRKYANQSDNSGGLVDIDSLYVPLAANDSVLIEAVITLGTSASNGIRWAVTIPAGATMYLTCQGAGSATIGKGLVLYITTSGTFTATTAAFTGASMETIIKGWVKNSSTAGTIQIQGMVPNVANTVTWYAGSWITAQKL